MLLYRILAATFLFCVSAIWAASYASLTAATYVLVAIVEGNIRDVDEVTLSTPLLAEDVPKAMIRLGVALNETTLANAGVKPSNVSSAENQLLNAYTVFANAIVNYTDAIETQKPVLAALGQQQAIENQVYPLVDSAYPFSQLVGGLLPNYDPTVYGQDNTDIFESLLLSLLRIYSSPD